MWPNPHFLNLDDGDGLSIPTSPRMYRPIVYSRIDDSGWDMGPDFISQCRYTEQQRPASCVRQPFDLEEKQLEQLELYS